MSGSELGTRREGKVTHVTYDGVAVGWFSCAMDAAMPWRWFAGTESGGMAGAVLTRARALERIREHLPEVLRRRREEEAERTRVALMPLGLRLLWQAWLSADFSYMAARCHDPYDERLVREASERRDQAREAYLAAERAALQKEAA